jgi:hypothetical protein
VHTHVPVLFTSLLDVHEVHWFEAPLRHVAQPGLQVKHVPFIPSSYVPFGEILHIQTILKLS